jgi:hypothetical protein
MEKLGKLSPNIQQLCYNHTLHLAVTEVFYVINLEDEASKERSSGSE